MLSVRLDESIEQRLQEVCRRFGYTKSEAVKRSLEQWLAAFEPAPDAYELGIDLFDQGAQILTTDRRDFDILRMPDGQPFERIWVKP